MLKLKAILINISNCLRIGCGGSRNQVAASQRKARPIQENGKANASVNQSKTNHPSTNLQATKNDRGKLEETQSTEGETNKIDIDSKRVKSNINQTNNNKKKSKEQKNQDTENEQNNKNQFEKIDAHARKVFTYRLLVIFFSR